MKPGDRIRRIKTTEKLSCGPWCVRGAVYTVLSHDSHHGITLLEDPWENKYTFNQDSFELVEEEKVKIPRVHAALIKAWADGAEIEGRATHIGKWEVIKTPRWNPTYEYRIQVEPKPDIHTYAKMSNLPGGYPNDYNDNGFWAHRLQHTKIKTPVDNIKCTYDGVTGKLKSVELINES